MIQLSKRPILKTNTKTQSKENRIARTENIEYEKRKTKEMNKKMLRTYEQIKEKEKYEIMIAFQMILSEIKLCELNV